MGLKVHELVEQVPVQLGTRGSQSRINYSTKVYVKYGHINKCHYFDAINIDKYDAIIGTVFMRKHSIMLDFGMDQLRFKDTVLPALREGADEYLLVCRQAMQHKDVLQTDKPVRNNLP